MAKPDQLQKIRTDVSTWNDYVSEQPSTFKADLAGGHLVGADLAEANLRRANLRRAYLVGANLRRANLAEADLTEADLRRSHLYEADLRGAALSAVDLTEADLRSANLNTAVLNGADLVGAYLIGANLAGAKLREADLTGANLTDADLAEADLTGATYGSSTVWPKVFAPDGARVRNEGKDELELDELGDSSSPDKPSQTQTSTESSIGQSWGQVVRIEAFDNQERLQMASRSIEVILGYFRQVLDDETLDGLDLGVLQSEYDVLTALARNPKGLNPQRVEQTIAEAMKVLGPQLSEESATNNFLNAVQRLGTPDPEEDGEVLIEVVEAAADIAAIEAGESAQTAEPVEEKERSFGRRVLDGMDNNAEELGKKILVDVVPDTAAKAVIAAATVATFAAAGKAAPALRAIVEFVISIIG